jgi:hypothetical protein
MHGARNMMMQTLKDLVEEIHLFTRSGLELSLAEFVSWLSGRTSIASLTVRDVYYICLNRLPETPSAATMVYETRAACARHIAECLSSREFRYRLPELIATSLPHLQRQFLVHIPRTGGTSLRRLIEDRCGILTWNESYVDLDWFDWEASAHGTSGSAFMLRFLSQFGRREPPAFIYTGHYHLGSLITRQLIRPQDRVLAVLRDPREVVISTVNYILTVASNQTRSPDAVDWTFWLQSLDAEWQPGIPPSAALIKQLVRSERFHADHHDMMTRYLSLDGTLQGALDATMITACQTIWVDRIGTYAREVLGINEAIGRENSSNDIVRQTGALTPALKKFIDQSLCPLDRELVQRLPQSLWMQSPDRPTRDDLLQACPE